MLLVLSSLRLCNKYMKAVELINRAYVLSGIVARNLSQVQGSEGIDGLFWLNQLLAEKSMTGDYIPYYGHQEFNGIPGVENYFVPRLVTVDVITFNIGDVRYSLRPSNRREYWGSSRANNISSLPYHYYAERVNNGMSIYFYFEPADAYLFTATGLLTLTDVANDDDLDDTLDKFYQSFLMFELAERLCQWKKISLPPATQEQLDKFRSDLYDLNPVDYRLSKQSLISHGNTLSYAQIAFGRGWTAP